MSSLRRILNSPLFGNADFKRLWGICGFNSFGMTGEQVVIGSLLFNLTGSSEWVGIAMALYFLPLAVFGNLSGIIADRMDRRKLLFRIEVLISLNLVVFASLVAFGRVELWLILVLSFASGTLRSMHNPVRASYTYDLLGGQHVVQALGMLNICIRSGMLAGALDTGAVFEGFGGSMALLSLFGVHLTALVGIVFLKTPGVSTSKVRSSISENLREYFLELRHNRSLLMIVAITGCVEIFGFSFATAMPELAEGRFDRGADGLGILHAARALGGLTAGLLLASMVSLKRCGRLYIGVIFLFGVGMILLALGDTFSLALLAILLVAMMATSSDILTQSMLQLNVSDHLRGRAMGTWSLAIGLAPVGHLEMGYLIVALGLGGALMANGLALVLTGLIVLFFLPGLRKL